MSSIEAVVFDLDGVLVDSEHVWDEVRALARDRSLGGPDLPVAPVARSIDHP